MTPADSKAKREAAFALYRDMGPARSYTKLREALEKTKHGDVSLRTMSTWAKEEHWGVRLAAWDKRQAPQQVTGADVDPNFNQADALLRTAHLALQRVLSSAPQVVKASDMKALTDAALGALKAVELINQRDVDKTPEVEGRAEMFRLLNAVEDRVRRSLTRVRLLETLLRANGIEVPPEDAAPAAEVSLMVRRG